MRISTEMTKAINEQISYEASSANTYIAIGRISFSSNVWPQRQLGLIPFSKIELKPE